MAHLTRITIYPFKSLDGVTLQRATVLPNGALEHDRRFAIVDEQGRFVNGKRTARIQQLRAAVDPVSRTIAIETSQADGERAFHLDADRLPLEKWLSEYFAVAVRVVENPEGGLPDDNEAPGPTLVSTATLRTVADWFGLGLAEVRRRFRANLEIDGVEPFWEDRLFGQAGVVVPFRVGGVLFAGTNPCQRCVVPSRDSFGGEPTAEFARAFARRREETLPVWAEPSRFDHFYRLAVNTRLVEPCVATIALSDLVEIV